MSKSTKIILGLLLALGVKATVYMVGYNTGFNNGYSLGYRQQNPRGIFPDPNPSVSPNPCQAKCDTLDARCVISHHFRCEM